jgi:hypothetical protein
MKLFADSASFGAIESEPAPGFTSGINTSASILAKEWKADVREHIRGISNVMQEYGEDISLRGDNLPG